MSPKAKSKAKTKTRTMEKQFTLKMEKSAVLKQIIETLAAIIDEVKITISKKKLLVEAMDPSRICILQLIIKRENFDDFKCSGKTEICVNLGDLDKILKRSTKNSIELSFQEETQKLKIKMQREEKEEGSSRVRTFSLAVLDSEIERAPLENLLTIDYEAIFNIHSDILIEALKDAEIYSDVLNVEITEETLIITSMGQIGELEYELSTEDLIETNIIGKNTGAYSVSFLKTIMKLAPITEQLAISLKTDHPINLKFNLLEGANLNYFLAPRVESDEKDFEGVEEIESLEPSIGDEEPEEEIKEEVEE